MLSAQMATPGNPEPLCLIMVLSLTEPSLANIAIQSTPQLLNLMNTSRVNCPCLPGIESTVSLGWHGRKSMQMQASSSGCWRDAEGIPMTHSNVNIWADGTTTQRHLHALTCLPYLAQVVSAGTSDQRSTLCGNNFSGDLLPVERIQKSLLFHPLSRPSLGSSGVRTLHRPLRRPADDSPRSKDPPGSDHRTR